MPKGRTTSPLVIVVAREWERHPKVIEWRDQGHKVAVFDIDYRHPEPDLILHPAAHQWNEHLFEYADAAITAARKRKREGKK